MVIRLFPLSDSGDSGVHLLCILKSDINDVLKYELVLA